MRLPAQALLSRLLSQNVVLVRLERYAQHSFPSLLPQSIFFASSACAFLNGNELIAPSIAFFPALFTRVSLANKICEPHSSALSSLPATKDSPPKRPKSPFPH